MTYAQVGATRFAAPQIDYANTKTPQGLVGRKSSAGDPRSQQLDQYYRSNKDGVYLRMLDDADPNRLTGNATIFKKNGKKLVPVGAKPINSLSAEEAKEQIQYRALYNPGPNGGKTKIRYNHYNDVQRLNSLQNVGLEIGDQNGRIDIRNAQTGQNFTKAEIKQSRKQIESQLKTATASGQITKDQAKEAKQEVKAKLKMVEGALKYDQKDGVADGYVDPERLNKKDQEKMLSSMDQFKRLKKPGFFKKLGGFLLGGLTLPFKIGGSLLKGVF